MYPNNENQLLQENIASIHDGQICKGCNYPIRDRFLMVLLKKFKSNESNEKFIEEYLHLQLFPKEFTSGSIINEKFKISNMDWSKQNRMKLFHRHCLICFKCGDRLTSSDEQCWIYQENKVICLTCRTRFVHCGRCRLRVTEDTWVHKVNHIPFHVSCFVCFQCGRQLCRGDKCGLYNHDIYCFEHYLAKFNQNLSDTTSTNFLLRQDEYLIETQRKLLLTSSSPSSSSSTITTTAPQSSPSSSSSIIMNGTNFLSLKISKNEINDKFGNEQICLIEQNSNTSNHCNSFINCDKNCLKNIDLSINQIDNNYILNSNYTKLNHLQTDKNTINASDGNTTNNTTNNNNNNNDNNNNNNNNNNNVNNNNCSTTADNNWFSSDDQMMSDDNLLTNVDILMTSTDTGYSIDSSTSSNCSPHSKSKRIRTSFTPDQLAILQANFDIEANPDGQELERIASNAKLNKRVTQVWFQNARARKKKIECRGINILNHLSMNGSGICCLEDHNYNNNNNINNNNNNNNSNDDSIPMHEDVFDPTLDIGKLSTKNIDSLINCEIINNSNIDLFEKHKEYKLEYYQEFLNANNHTTNGSITSSSSIANMTVNKITNHINRENSNPDKQVQTNQINNNQSVTNNMKINDSQLIPDSHLAQMNLNTTIINNNNIINNGSLATDSNFILTNQSIEENKKHLLLNNFTKYNLNSSNVCSQLPLSNMIDNMANERKSDNLSPYSNNINRCGQKSLSYSEPLKRNKNNYYFPAIALPTN